VLAHPQLELRDGTLVKDVTAREVHGEEKARWWARAVEAFPNYAEYQRKTEREIPLFLLE
jgi:deazaflavin-dependent oxidoreductase (nitroreductase family)